MFLFVGGLPRTGTSMFMKSIDGHPDIFSMPREVSCLPMLYFHQEKNLEIENLLTCDEFRLLERHGLDQMSKAYQHDFDLLFDSDKALSIFSETFESDQGGIPNIKKVLSPLKIAYLGGLRGGADKKIFALKYPFYSELMFNDIKTLFPDSKLIVLRRSQADRFASSAERYKRVSSGNWTHRFGLDYITWQVLLDVTSNHIVSGLREIYPHDVLVLDYEKFYGDCSNLLDDLCRWLGVPFNDCLLQTTVFGCGTDKTGSSRDLRSSQVGAKSDVGMTDIYIDAIDLYVNLTRLVRDKVDFSEKLTKLSELNLGHITPTDNRESPSARVRFFQGEGRYCLSEQAMSCKLLDMLKKNKSLM